jgi:hypothetical protein
MKASVAEIYKDHCILITEDGRFVRYNTPAGAYEIGDEIIIEDADFFAAGEKSAKRSFGMFAKLAAGFAAIVILSSVSYFAIKYAGSGFSFSPANAATQIAQAKIADLPGQESTEGGYATMEQSGQAIDAESPASESGAAVSQSPESSADISNSAKSPSTSNQESGQSDETLQSQDSMTDTSVTNSKDSIALPPWPVLFQETIKPDKNNIDILIDYPDLLVTYKLEQAYGQDSDGNETGTFTLKIKNLQKSTFTGNTDIIFTDKNNSTLQASAIEIGILDYYDTYTACIQVKGNIDSFTLTLYGSFNEP